MDNMLLEKLQEHASKVTAGIGFCLVVVSLLFVFLANMDYQSAMDEKQEELVSLREQMNQVADGSGEKISEDGVKSQLHSVKQVGDKIAGWQNRYMVLGSSAYRKGRDYSEDKVRLEETELAENLDKYFGDGSGFRTRWFAGDATKMNNTQCWSFMNSYDFAENTISVLWVCEDEHEDVVAYVTADYHADTDSFDNAKRHETVASGQYLDVTTDKSLDELDEKEYTKQIQNIFENAGLSEEFQKEMKKAREREGQAENQESNNESRLKLREQMMENGGE